MTDAVLTLNAGSSSVKFALFEQAPGSGDPQPVSRGEIDRIGGRPRLAIREASGRVAQSEDLAEGLDHEGCLALLLQRIDARLQGLSLAAVGHRVVHGGSQFAAPVLIDETVVLELEKLVPLAPLHQPHNLAAIRSIAAARPGLPQVACFDTGFHRTNSVLETTFALPRALTAQGVRRFGFHGLSYEYIAGVLPRLGAGIARGRVVVAHLGHGASMCAMRDGRSVATTMGFTALDGLPMGRRCGALDPGVILFLMREKHMDHDALSDLLYQRSGLLGISGISDDMRDLLASDSDAARQAVELFTYRIGRELGSLAAALGGLDALVFTGGIGEHAGAVRARVCEQAKWLGVSLDAAANEQGGERISRPRSAVSVFVLPTNEELMIARHAVAVLRQSGALRQA